MSAPILSQSFVKSRFKYKDGRLFHRCVDTPSAARNSKFAGKECRTDSNGYYVVGITLNGRNHQYFVHRIIYLIHHGFMPEEVDHEDGNKTNNRIRNLRDVSHQENMKNKRMYKNNSSGVTGVEYRKDTGKWRAKIKVKGRGISLGCYEDINDAIAARGKAAIEYGFQSIHGI